MVVACEETVRLSNLFFNGYILFNVDGTSTTNERKTLNKLSPFAIHKGVNVIAGGDVTIKCQFNGDIYLPCSKKSQFDELL